MPHLLADVDSFVAVVFMLVAFFGWVMNLINQNKPGQPPRPGMKPKPGKKAPKDLQSDIERFLNETLKQQDPPVRQDTLSPTERVEQLERPQKGPSKRRAPPTAQRRRTQKEIWEEQTKSRERGQRPVVTPSLSRPTGTTSNLPSQTARNRPGEAFPQKGKGNQRSTPPARQKQKAAERYPSAVQNSPKSSISPATARPNLKAFSAVSPESTGEQGISATVSSAQSPAGRIARMMRNPTQVRDLIIMGEVLSRPRALTRNNR